MRTSWRPNLYQEVPLTFCHCSVESILTHDILVLDASCTAADKKNLNTQLPPLENMYRSRSLHWAHSAIFTSSSWETTSHNLISSWPHEQLMFSDLDWAGWWHKIWAWWMSLLRGPLQTVLITKEKKREKSAFWKYFCIGDKQTKKGLRLTCSSSRCCCYYIHLGILVLWIQPYIQDPHL